jgi:hypothetical protein
MSKRGRKLSGELVTPVCPGDVPDTLSAVPDTSPSPARLQASAIAALQSVADDPGSPAAARAQAARTILEYLGGIGRHAKPPEEAASRSLASMSRSELLAELSAMRGERSAKDG